MSDYPLLVKIVASVMVIGVYLMLPLYGLWLLGGELADQLDMRRTSRQKRGLLS